MHHETFLVSLLNGRRNSSTVLYTPFQLLRRQMITIAMQQRTLQQPSPNQYTDALSRRPFVIADQPQCGPDTKQAAPGSEAPKSAAARLWSRLATAMLLIAPAPEAKCIHRSIRPPTRETDGSNKTTYRWARRGTTAAGEGMMALGLGAPECDPPQDGKHLAMLRQRRLALPTVRQPQTLQSTHATASKQRRSPH